MRKLVSLALLLPLLGLLGCVAVTSKSGPQTGGPTTGRTESLTPVTPAAKGGPASATALALTPENTKIQFVGTKPEGKHDGGFNSFAGSIDLPDDLSKASVKVEIDADSLYSDQNKLTAHLKSPDFFDIKKFPKATFVSTKITENKAGGATHTITGDLTLHGQTKEVSIPAKVEKSADGLRLTTSFKINRQDFGMKYGPGKIHDDVAITVNVDAKRK